VFSKILAKPQGCGVSRTLEARDGFPELQEGFMCFLKYHTFGANPVNSYHLSKVFGRKPESWLKMFFAETDYLTFKIKGCTFRIYITYIL
jgi:hypothetical protein